MEFDQSVIDKARNILQPIYVSENPPHFPGNSQGETSNDHMELNSIVNTCDANVNRGQTDVIITGSRGGESGYHSPSITPHVTPSISMEHVERITNNIEVKKEEAEQEVTCSRSKKFSADEDRYLKLGMEKYGKSNWSQILHDKDFKFHPKRTRDSLRMRAETCGFKTKKNKNKPKNLQMSTTSK